MAGRAGTGVVIGVGGDAPALRTLGDRARAAHREAGRSGPFEVWALVVVHVAADDDEASAMRMAIAPAAIGNARNAFSQTWEMKNVPEALQEPMGERLGWYQFTQHAVVGDENPNVHLFDDRPDILRYLLDRFTIVGTETQCRERLTALIDGSGVDGVWMSVVGPTPVETAARAGQAFAGVLDRQRS